MRSKRVDPDRRVAALAARQHGLITTDQLRTVGVDHSAISRRTDAGRLHRIFRGVYAVGHAGLSTEGRWLAAVLACGEGAALSHRSAAEFWGLLAPSTGPVHVSVPVAGGRRRRTGLRIHRVASLGMADVTLRHRIPVTGPARTLHDLRGALPSGAFRRAVREAEIRDLAIHGRDFVPDGTTSELEDRFLRLVRRHGLPAPETNVRIHGIRVDFLWRERMLVVETDGFRFHRGSVAFEEDRDRDNRLMALGYDVVRFTYEKVTKRPYEVVELLRKRLLDA